MLPREVRDIEEFIAFLINNGCNRAKIEFVPNMAYYRNAMENEESLLFKKTFRFLPRYFLTMRATDSCGVSVIHTESYFLGAEIGLISRLKEETPELDIEIIGSPEDFLTFPAQSP